MAKKKKTTLRTSRQKRLFVDEIASSLDSGPAQDLVILFIPSQDRHNRPIQDQDQWAKAGMELFADIFGGATAFRTFAGVFKSKTGDLLWDDPIAIESYVDRENLVDVENLLKLKTFCDRMGSGTNGTAGDFCRDQRSSEPRRHGCVCFL